jgi:hypothetical protein
MPAETGITSSLTSFSIREIKEATTELNISYYAMERMIFLVFTQAFFLYYK